MKVFLFAFIIVALLLGVALAKKPDRVDPEANSASFFTLQEDGTLVGDLSTVFTPDPGCLPVTFIARPSEGSKKGKVDFSVGGIFTYTPKKKFNGWDQFQYKAKDKCVTQADWTSVTLDIAGSTINPESPPSTETAEVAVTTNQAPRIIFRPPNAKTITVPDDFTGRLVTMNLLDDPAVSGLSKGFFYAEDEYTCGDPIYRMCLTATEGQIRTYTYGWASQICKNAVLGELNYEFGQTLRYRARSSATDASAACGAQAKILISITDNGNCGSNPPVNQLSDTDEITVNILPAAGQVKLGFDDILNDPQVQGGGLQITNRYGITWTNFYIVDSNVNAANPSGYRTADISSPNVLANGGGGSASFKSANNLNFDFNSAYFASVCKVNMKVRITCGAKTVDVTLDANLGTTGSPKKVQIGCTNVNTVNFAIVNPQTTPDHPNWSTVNPSITCATWFTMDDMCFTNIGSNIQTTP